MQWSTGKRGYFGKRESESERPHRRKVEPLSDVMILPCRQVAQRPNVISLWYSREVRRNHGSRVGLKSQDFFAAIHKEPAHIQRSGG